MIQGFEPPSELPPEQGSKFQLRPALFAGLIAGGILLVIPSGSPWERMTFFSPVVLGRVIPATLQMPLMATWLLHLVLSLVCGLIIARVVSGFRKGRAFFAGAMTGLLLYLANLAAVSAFWPGLRGDEIPVVFTHIVFGLIAAGAYRGLLKRTPTAVRTESA